MLLVLICSDNNLVTESDINTWWLTIECYLVLCVCSGLFSVKSKNGAGCPRDRVDQSTGNVIPFFSPAGHWLYLSRVASD